VLAEKQRVDAERERTLREEKKSTIWIVIAVVVVLLAIIGFVVYKRMKAKAIAN
jgi:flagellar basal body-associated protein FliL